MIRARRLRFGYGEKRVIENLSLAVNAGEVVAIIGPSGVGKSTLLRLLALYLRPEDGTVEIGGRSAWELEETDRLELRRQFGMVFQEASLFDATVTRNVEYGLRVRRSWPDRLGRHLNSLCRRDGTATAVEDALDVVGLREKADQGANTLSGGEAQRVSFARALAYDPSYLLLDEPTSDLDPRNTALIEDAVREAKNRGIGVVIATHDMHQARRVADRVGVFLDGTLAEVGPTERVFEDPSDERTRKFVSGELVY